MIKSSYSIIFLEICGISWSFFFSKSDSHIPKEVGFIYFDENSFRPKDI